MKDWEIVGNSEDWRLIWRPGRARIQNPYQEPDQECIPVQVLLRLKVPVFAIRSRLHNTAEDQTNSFVLGIVEDFKGLLGPDHH